jgi:dihydroxyacetone kinase-like protein
VVRAFGAAIAAVKKIGRSDVGQKTMLDVLAPVHVELAVEAPALLARVRQRGAASADATIPMKASKGRARRFSANARSAIWIPARDHRR